MENFPMRAYVCIIMPFKWIGKIVDQWNIVWFSNFLECKWLVSKWNEHMHNFVLNYREVKFKIINKCWKRSLDCSLILISKQRTARWFVHISSGTNAHVHSCNNSSHFQAECEQYDFDMRFKPSPSLTLSSAHRVKILSDS